MEDRAYEMLEHRRQLTATAQHALEQMASPGVKVYLGAGTSATAPYVLVVVFTVEGLAPDRQDELLARWWEGPARPLLPGRMARRRHSDRAVRYHCPL